jgi:hypothetical protein
MYRIVTREDIPVDQTYRNAWRLSDTEEQLISIDLDKAKDIWKNRMRQARELLFPKLDTQYFIALERGTPEDQKAIANRKQLLRDVTQLPELEAARTIEELEAVWPDYLDKEV